MAISLYSFCYAHQPPIIPQASNVNRQEKLNKPQPPVHSELFSMNVHQWCQNFTVKTKQTVGSLQGVSAMIPDQARHDLTVNALISFFMITQRQ